MRLGVVLGERRGATDRALAEVAQMLAEAGWQLLGVVQENPEVPGRRCEMELVLLGLEARGQRVRISQCLGREARGCRLDPVGLEEAAGRVAAALEASALHVNALGGKPELGQVATRSSRARGEISPFSREPAASVWPDLLIVNKFGKAEALGRGFRPVIARALELEVPVLVGLNRSNRESFDAFAEGLAEFLPAEPSAILAWCESVRVDAL